MAHNEIQMLIAVDGQDWPRGEWRSVLAHSDRELLVQLADNVLSNFKIGAADCSAVFTGFVICTVRDGVPARKICERHKGEKEWAYYT